MYEDPKFCRERASRERLAAADTSLMQAKGRHLHAAVSWDRMAERGEAHLRSKARRLLVEAQVAEAGVAAA